MRNIHYIDNWIFIFKFSENDSGSQVHGRTKNLKNFCIKRGEKNFCIKRGESTQVREEEVDLQMKAEMFTNEITSIWVNFKNTCQILLTYLDNGRFRFYED